MLATDRPAFILKEIEARGSVSVVDLAERLQVSLMTIRRDLVELERAGLVRRVHGGAVNARGRGFEPPLLLRSSQKREAKALIGRMAAELVADGDSLALDIGTTTYELARNLVGRRNLTIITPSLHIANLLLNEPDMNVIVTGGIVRHGEASLIGDLAVRAFEGLFVDRLFLGAGAVDSHAGVTEYNWDDALVKRAMTKSAKETILLADASKFERVAFASVVPLSDIHRLVTDEAPPPALMEALRASQVVVQLPEAAEMSQRDLDVEEEGTE